MPTSENYGLCKAVQRQMSPIKVSKELISAVIHGRRNNTAVIEAIKYVRGNWESIKWEKFLGLFEKRVYPEPNTGCWLWGGAINDKGYGQIYDGYSVKYAHRISYKIYKGEIPKGLLVCHHCDNPICVNPEHLFLGTHKDNNMDMIRKGRDSKEYLKNFKSGPGELAPSSKLTNEEVLEIREMWKEKSVVKIAQILGISKHTIHSIVYRRSWKHI